MRGTDNTDARRAAMLLRSLSAAGSCEPGMASPKPPWTALRRPRCAQRTEERRARKVSEGASRVHLESPRARTLERARGRRAPDEALFHELIELEDRHQHREHDHE